MKKLIISLAAALFCVTLFPVAAQAQGIVEKISYEENTPAYFTPKVEEGRGLFLFEHPIYYTSLHSGNSMRGNFGIMHGEQVRVDKLRDNGWAEVTYVRPSTGTEYTGFILMRALLPVPTDEKAVALKAQFDEFEAWEMRVMKWSVILVIAGLIISFLTFLPRVIRLPLMIAILFGMSAMIVRFMLSTGGFTYFLPTVYGWKWAAIWFGCFTLFLAAKIFFFIMTLQYFDRGTLGVAGGGNLIAMICIVIFYAFYALFGFLSMIPFFERVTIPFEWVNENFLWVFIGIQVIMLIFLISSLENKWKAIFVVPLYIVGFGAIVLVVNGLLLAYIVAGLLFFAGSAGPLINYTPAELEKIKRENKYREESDRRRKREEEARRPSPGHNFDG